MGTSNSYGGPGGSTPLVPSWLGTDAGASPNLSPDRNIPQDANADYNNDESADNSNTNAPKAPPDRNVIPVASSDRFRSSRTNFTQFVKSGGQDRSRLGKALSSYVSTSSGGAKNASKRMGSSRKATTNLVNFLSSVQTQGSKTALEALNLGRLVGKSVEEIFLGLAEYICPDGGNVDEGIARSAFIETIAELADVGIVDIDSLSAEQMQTVLEIFATHSIEERLCNDIGTKICIASESIQAFEQVQAQLHDFIKRSVSDALTRANINLKTLTPDKTLGIVDHIYESAFNILQALAEVEAESK